MLVNAAGGGAHVAYPKGRYEVVAHLKDVIYQCEPSHLRQPVFDERSRPTHWRVSKIARVMRNEDSCSGTANLFDERTRINWMFTAVTGTH